MIFIKFPVDALSAQAKFPFRIFIDGGNDDPVGTDRNYRDVL
jgi:hypothetical protein